MAPNNKKAEIESLIPKVKDATAKLDPEELRITEQLHGNLKNMMVGEQPVQEAVDLAKNTLEPQYNNALCYMCNGQQPPAIYLAAELK